MAEESISHHDVGFLRLGVFYPRPVRRAIARRQIRPCAWEKMVVNVDDLHASLARMNRAAKAYICAGSRCYRTVQTEAANLLRCSSASPRRGKPIDGNSGSTHSNASRDPSARGTSILPRQSQRAACGECRMSLVKEISSPSLIGISNGGLPGVSIMRSTMAPFSVIEEFFRGIVVIVAPLVRPTTTVTIISPSSHTCAFPTGRLELLFIFFRSMTES